MRKKKSFCKVSKRTGTFQNWEFFLFFFFLARTEPSRKKSPARASKVQVNDTKLASTICQAYQTCSEPAQHSCRQPQNNEFHLHLPLPEGGSTNRNIPHTCLAKSLLCFRIKPVPALFVCRLSFRLLCKGNHWWCMKYGRELLSSFFDM